MNTFTTRQSISIKTFIVISVFALLLGTASGYAQNAKGDKPSRESRFKLPPKGKPIKKKRPTARVKSKKGSSANRASYATQTKRKPQGGDRVGKPIRPIVSSQPSSGDRAWRGSANGSRVSVRSTSGKTRNVYPQFGKYSSNRSISGRQQKTWGKQRVAVRSATGRTKNVFPQFGKYNRDPSKMARSKPSIQSNRREIARAQNMSQKPGYGKQRGKVRPRSASSSYLARRSINPYAGFFRKTRPWEQAYNKDIAGKPLRTRNYRSPGQVLEYPKFNANHRLKPRGDRPYKGPTQNYVSASRGGRAWKGDIAGRKIRGRNYQSKVTTEGITGGYRSATRRPETRTGKAPLDVRQPRVTGVGSWRGNQKLFEVRRGFTKQGADYAGNVKTRRPAKGGGSVSGQRWNNQGRAIAGKTPKGGAAIGSYQGNIKRYQLKPPMGTQGVDSRGNLRAYQLKPPMTKQGVDSRGNLRAFQLKPPMTKQGVDSRGNLRAYQLKPPMTKQGVDSRGNLRLSQARHYFSRQGEDYSGNIKARRPAKGGGSVSGKLWNNNETPVSTRTPSGEAARIGSYSGNMKARKPLKGGGSVSGKLWNNNETPIDVRTPSGEAAKAGSYQGNLKQDDIKYRMQDQGEEFTGFIKLKQRQIIRHPKVPEDGLLTRSPHPSTYQAGGLQVAVKQKDNKLRKNAPEGALPSLTPSKASTNAYQFSRSMKQYWRYKHNPSSADEALDTKDPGRAFARASDYQGNIKMKKFDLFGKKGLHPDAQFMKTNKNNVDEERSLGTNLKLFWARLFRKNETLPESVKEKSRKPRYDKGESQLWYNDHNNVKGGKGTSRKPETVPTETESAEDNELDKN